MTPKVDEQRARHKKLDGEYPTPLAWVQHAHLCLDQCIGPDWHQSMTVWDASCGVGNLLRLRPFASLIATTLHVHDVDAIPFPARIRLAVDFLASMAIPDEIGDVLRAADAILFLNNPPHKTVNEQTFHGRVRRAAGRTNTGVKQAMRAMSLNRCGDQLSVQFMFKITEVMRGPVCQRARRHDAAASVYMAMFLPANILTGPAYQPMRSYLEQHWQYAGGFMMPAQAFAGVRGVFSIAFVVWRCRPNPVAPGTSHQSEFDLRLLEPSDSGGGDIIDSGRVRLRPARPDQRLNLWARSRTPCPHRIAVTPLTSALTVQTEYTALTVLVADALGYLHSNANSVQHNDQLVGLYSSAFAAGHGVVVRPENFERACAVFTARRLVVPRTWSNWLLEYRWPRTGGATDGFDRWCQDAVVYALFDSKSNQSALRTPLRPVLNQWFWMGRARIRALACAEVVADLDADQSDSERFVYEWLQRHRIGAAAQALLTFAEECVVESMALRAAGEYGTRAWDAGWYQIRRLLGCGTDGAARFLRTWNALRSSLGVRLLDGVYEFGFLSRQ